MSLPTVRIISSHTEKGGSTEALIHLCNLFNDFGLETIFYGSADWYQEKCRSGKFSDLKIFPSDILITHNFQIPVYPNCKLHILSCHEKDKFPVQKFDLNIWDKIHFVSKQQQEWHGEVQITTKVIPNVLPKLKPNKKISKNVAGVIGSIDPNKQTHLSIQRALSKGYAPVLLFIGNIDSNYYGKYVEHLIDNKTVIPMGFYEDKQAMYDQVNCVFHSSKSECASYVEYECKLTNTKMDFLDSSLSDGEVWTNNQIFDAWMNFLEIDHAF